MMHMKQGDEDLVDDDQNVMMSSSRRHQEERKMGERFDLEDELDDQREDLAFNESTAEQKVTGNIPMLKNNKNALIRNSKPFSQRLKSGELKVDFNDVHAVASQMMFEINLLAGKTLVLQHRLIEVMRIAPRFITDYLCLEHREKVRNQLNDSIYRNVVETADFALPSEENIGEAHRLFANTKRANLSTMQNYGIRVYDLAQYKEPT